MMSLHVGLIPPHIRQHELERVFRRFGRCKVELKDGYGFAVFEVAADAEKALKALRGKNICGKPLSLNWSNIQPQPLQRSARPLKMYEPCRRKNFRKDENRVWTRGSEDRRNFSTANSHIKHRDDVPARGADYVPKDIDDIGEERGMTMKEGVAHVGNLSEPNAMETDRWGVPISDKIAGNEMGNDADFDRYEPYHGYERGDKKENQLASSYGSPYHGSPHESEKNADTSKPQPTCYNCGLADHIKRYCPEVDAKREKFGKFSHRNFRGRDDEKRKMPRISRGPVISRHNEMDRKESRFRNSRKLARRTMSFLERREKNRPKLEAESHEKRRSQKKCETQKNMLKRRRSRRFDSSSLSSNSSTSSSRKHSGTSKSKSLSSHSTSRSMSRKSPSTCSSSKSASIPSCVKSKSPRSESQSRSSLHRSPSLSVSLDKKSPSSPKDANLNISEDRASPKENVDHSVSPTSKHLLHDNMENFEVSGNNGSITCKIDNEIDAEYLGKYVDLVHYSPSSSSYKQNYSSTNLPKDVAVVSETCGDGSRLKETLKLRPNEHIAIASDRRNSTKFTTQEMISALKHYGLPAPKEDESCESIGEYFGAARLWPWELIYYRRLKKGPISTENYARRLQQNEEFGIIDRYIRSSSGWGELQQNDML